MYKYEQPLKVRPPHCLEMPGIHYTVTWQHIPEELRFQLRSCESLITHTKYYFVIKCKLMAEVQNVIAKKIT
jgi:hypothetical protein